MLKPWLFWKTKGNAPKNRYKIPNKIADRMQRLKHWCTTVSPPIAEAHTAETHHGLEEEQLKRPDA